MYTNSLKTAALALLGLSISLFGAQALAGTNNDRAEHFRQKMQERIEAMDTDGDGAISLEEYLTNAEKMFARLDLDGDGYVTVEEREEIRAQFHERRGRQFP
jgi:Ca2+-binding EF-hand superfamily protein